jgi:hypothetical protein
MNKYSVLVQKLLHPSFLAPLSEADKKEAVHAANVFSLADAFLRGERPSSVGLDVLIEAEKTVERLRVEYA